MSQAEARQHAAEGKWAEAAALMHKAIERQPDATGLWRDLVAMVEKLDDPEQLRLALQGWAAADRGFGGLEAEERLMLMEGRGRTIPSRMRHLMRLGRLELRERRLRRASTPLSERLALFMHRDLAGECAEALRAAPLDEKLALGVDMMRRLLAFYVAKGKVEHFIPDLCDGDASRLAPRPFLVGTLAIALARNGAFQAAEQAVALVPDGKSFQHIHFAVEHLIATGLKDVDRQRVVLEAWSSEYPDNPSVQRALLLARVEAGDFAAVVAQVTDAGFGGLGAPAVLDVARQMVEARDDMQAFRLLTLAADHWPQNLRVAERLAAVAQAVGEYQIADETRQRRLLMDELDADLIALIGSDSLLAAGGRQPVHQAVMATLGEAGDGSGLLDLARLAMASLRVVVTVRTGQRREARELAAHGAANWEGRQADAARLAQLIRGLCALALRASPGDTAALDLLLELQLITGDGGSLTEQLVRSLMTERPLTRQPLQEGIWTAALSCDAPGLWADLAGVEAERGATLSIMRFAPLSPDGAILRHAGTALSKLVGVTGPNFSGQVQLSLPTMDEYRSGPRPVDLWGGYLVSPADTDGERTVLNLVSNGFLPHPLDRVRHIGSKAVAVDPGGEPVVIDRPTLFVPGLRPHYRNYYHFLGQLLPRLLALRDEARADLGAPVAIALPGFASGFITSMLALCGVGEDEILHIPMDQPVRLQNCMIASPTLHDWQCAVGDLSRLRQALRANHPGATPQRRLFLSRPVQSVTTSGRVLTNEAELMNVARTLGYEIIDPGAMTQAQQSELFTQAEVICGPTGAALTNALYLPDGARVVCLSPQETCRTYFPGLTLGQEIGFDWVLGRFDPRLTASRRSPHLPYRIDPDHLREVLAR